jgi:hypothetical protein
MNGAPRYVRSVPLAAERSAAKSVREQLRRNLKAGRLSAFQVNDELEFGRLHNRELGGTLRRERR